MSPTGRDSFWCPDPGLRRRPGRPGQVMVVMLLALALLVGLVFYVYNLGDQVNRRLRCQNDADAVAISGAGWMARSMNLIAMNNVAIARLLALVPVLDALPLAVEMTMAEVPHWERALESLLDKLGKGDPAQLTLRERQVLADVVRALISSWSANSDPPAKNSEILGAIDDVLNASGFSMPDVTHWSVGRRRGRIWQAMAALDELSEAAAVSSGLLAQHNAVRFGRDNGAGDACMLPFAPAIPAKVGEFEDFEPVLLGGIKKHYESRTVICDLVTDDWQNRAHAIGGAIGDWADPHRLGPWYGLYKWRIEWHRYYDPGTGYKGPADQFPENISPWRPDLFGPKTTPKIKGQKLGERTYGPYSWALREFRSGLRETNFFYNLQSVADVKLQYMFAEDRPPDLQTVHMPEFISDYDGARKIAMQDASKVKGTYFFWVAVRSAVPRRAPGWLGERQVTDPKTGEQVTVKTYSVKWVSMPRPEKGWVDPSDKGYDKLPGVAVWEYIWDMPGQTTSFPEIGLFLEYDEQGNPKYHPFWEMYWCIFCGIDIGDEVEVANPCNFSDGEMPPGPILLDTSVGDYDPVAPEADGGYRRALFTYLGIAWRPTEAGVWPSRFRSASPDGRMFGLAQASVFNNTSWDLWTQDWQAQLVPVTRLDLWRQQLAGRAADSFLVDDESVDLTPFGRFLDALDDGMVDTYMHH